MASYIFEEGYPGPKALHSFHEKPQLLINVVDGLARARPATLYGQYPVSPVGYDKGIRNITYGDLANVVNGAAWWLVEKLGPGTDFKTICYTGWNDIRYVAFLLGAVKAGYKLLFTSPSNSAEGIEALFKALDCQTLLTPEPRPPTVGAFLGLSPLNIFSIPSMEDLLDTPHQHFPYNKTFEDAKNEPLVAIHTSGTTGLPKPIIYTNDFAAAFARWLRLDPPEGYVSMEKLGQGSRVFTLTPPFHCSAILVMIDAISGQTAYVYPPAAVFPTAAVVKEGLKYTDVLGVIGGAMTIAECAKNTELLDFFASRFNYMTYGGGDVAQSLGDAVSSKLKLYAGHGSTECSAFPLIRRRGEWDAKDWKYIQPHPATGLEFRHYKEDLYEAIFVRNSDPKLEQPVFKLFPDLNEFPTRDLFSEHPTKPGLWMYKSRSDDMINLSTGAMANPAMMENAVLSCTEVNSVVMLPVQQSGVEGYCLTTALLVEPASFEGVSAERQAALTDSIWPIVQETNKLYRIEACISKANIMFAKQQKPLPKNAKGGIRRGKVLEIYKDEIDALAKASGF